MRKLTWVAETKSSGTRLVLDIHPDVVHLHGKAAAGERCGTGYQVGIDERVRGTRQAGSEDRVTEFGANGPGVKFDALTMPSAE